MKPIHFCCEQHLPLAPKDIAEQILDLTKWPEFQGSWPIPGIKSAEFKVRTTEIIGTQIQVTNLDGSSHVEEIVEWHPDRQLRLQMHDFSPPLSRLATTFHETWEFERQPEGTKVIRSFQIYPKSLFARIPLRLIAIFLKRAIVRHLREMSEAAKIE